MEYAQGNCDTDDSIYGLTQASQGVRQRLSGMQQAVHHLTLQGEHKHSSVAANQRMAPWAWKAYDAPTLLKGANCFVKIKSYRLALITVTLCDVPLVSRPSGFCFIQNSRWRIVHFTTIDYSKMKYNSRIEFGLIFLVYNSPNSSLFVKDSPVSNVTSQCRYIFKSPVFTRNN